jgi:hypothetical protein
MARDRPTYDGRWVVAFVFGPAILGVLLLVVPFALVVFWAPGPALITVLASIALVAIPALVALSARRRAALEDVDDTLDTPRPT